MLQTCVPLPHLIAHTAKVHAHGLANLFWLLAGLQLAKTCAPHHSIGTTSQGPALWLMLHPQTAMPLLPLHTWKYNMCGLTLLPSEQAVTALTSRICSSISCTRHIPSQSLVQVAPTGCSDIFSCILDSARRVALCCCHQSRQRLRSPRALAAPSGACWAPSGPDGLQPPALAAGAAPPSGTGQTSAGSKATLWESCLPQGRAGSTC